MPNLPRQHSPKRKTERHSTGDRRFYKSAGWQKLRSVVLRNEPLCRAHRSAGYLVPASVVDHIIAITASGHPSHVHNLMPLCSICHDRKSAMERHGLSIEAATVDGLKLPTTAAVNEILGKLSDLL
jgi:5-methylcytosine-specific restriction endonuclease McrA